MGMINVVFEEVTNPHKKGRILSKEEAERIIRKNLSKIKREVNKMKILDTIHNFV